MSLNNRVIWNDNNSKLRIKRDPEIGEQTLYYRYIRLSDAKDSTPEFTQGNYQTEISIKKGEILELKEGEETIILAQETYHPKFSVKVQEKKGRIELSFSTNPGLHLSRVWLEDPQKKVYALGLNGTLDEKRVWYLPSEAMFSRNLSSNAWHIKLDTYSESVYDYVIE